MATHFKFLRVIQNITLLICESGIISVPMNIDADATVDEGQMLDTQLNAMI